MHLRIEKLLCERSNQQFKSCQILFAGSATVGLGQLLDVVHQNSGRHFEGSRTISTRKIDGPTNKTEGKHDDDVRCDELAINIGDRGPNNDGSKQSSIDSHNAAEK